MKIKKYVALLFAIVYFSSCDSYLDSVPYSFTTIDNFYKTADQMESALTGCYGTLTSYHIQNFGTNNLFAYKLNVMLDASTDELFTTSGQNGDYADLGYLAYQKSNIEIRYTYAYLYAGINRVNYLLANIDNIESSTRRDQIEGEAHFLRGIFYYYAGVLFGGVPLIIDPVVDPKAPRNTLEEVFKLVIDDFEFAYNILPERPSIKGRASRWSAAGYLVKVYTYLESCKRNNVGADLDFDLNSFNWVDIQSCNSKVLSLTEDIINNSGYILTENYELLFRETTETYQYEECLFTIESSNDIVTTDRDFIMWAQYHVPKGSVTVLGGSVKKFVPTGELYYKYVPEDLRRDNNLGGSLNSKLTEDIEGITYYVPNSSDPTKSTYNCTKFRMMHPQHKKINIANCSGNWPILRFADILLLRAEALFYDGKESEARDLITQVRTRSVNDPADVSVLNSSYYKDNFLDELLDERSRELCFETHRRIDLIRFNRLGEAINSLSAENSYAYQNALVVPTLKQNWASYKIWYPVPSAETDLNPSLIQNPGY